jgi:Fe-S oxidoreductase
MNSRSYCTYCPKMCHFSCPVAEAEKDEATTPWGKQQTARLIDQKVLPLNEETARAAYQCVTCRASESFCDHKIVVADSLQELREKAVSAHAAPSAVHAFAEKFKKHNNPYGLDLQEKILKKAKRSWLDPKKPGVFFPSCHTLALNPAGLTESLGLFEKLRIEDVRVFSDTIQCCGYLPWVLGLRSEFEDLVQMQFHSLRDAKWIVVGAPECAWTFREIYPRFHHPLPATVFTLPDFISGYLKHLPYRSKPRAQVHYFYHDACYLGRYLHQYDEPRQLLEMVTGFPPEEFSWNREEAVCSGAGGGYPLIFPETSRAIARRHLEEMAQKGVSTLVTGCPQAAHQFQSLKSKIVVKDLVSFIGQTLLDLPKTPSDEE